MRPASLLRYLPRLLVGLRVSRRANSSLRSEAGSGRMGSENLGESAKQAWETDAAAVNWQFFSYHCIKLG